MAIDRGKIKQLALDGLKTRLMKNKQYFLMEIFREVTETWEINNLEDSIKEGTPP